MATLSLCMIVKNEEQWIKQCLESVQELVDEIIIVDTGSIDNTCTIIRNLPYASKIKLLSFSWQNDFSAARNFAKKHATKDWILVLDADEILAKQDHQYIKKIISQTKFPAATFVQRHYLKRTDVLRAMKLDEKDRYGQLWQPYGFKAYLPTIIIRLFANDPRIVFTGKVHESIEQSIKEHGIKIIKTDIPIHHYQFLKSKEQYKEKQDHYLVLLQEKEQEEPENIKNLHDLAVVYLQKKNDAKKALEYFKKIHAINAELLEPYLGIGIICYKFKDYEKAINNFKKGLLLPTTTAIEASATVEHIQQAMLYNLAQCYRKINDLPKAEHIEELLRKKKSALVERLREQKKQSL